jgi:TonB family protein
MATDPQRPTRRGNLALSALIALALLAGFAWYGERTHGSPFGKPIRDITVDLKPMPALEQEPADRNPDSPQEPAGAEKKPVPVMQADLPAPSRPDAFTQPVEPPPVVATEHTTTRNIDTSGLPGPGTFDPSQVDQVPGIRVQVRPEYPSAMRAEHVTGEVLVDFIVDATGAVRNAHAVRSSRPEFEEAAVRAVGRWRFSAGMRGGRTVAVHMQVPIVFSLDVGS